MTGITGKTLIDWGFKPARWFKAGVEEAQKLRAAGADDPAIVARLHELQPREIMLRTNSLPFGLFIEAENDLERANVDAVIGHMDVLMRTPTIKAGAVMPDACPAGAQPGTIPVGGVVACEDAIHPGFHSADICCSVAISVFNREEEARKIIDAALAVTHFGPTRRKTPIAVPEGIRARIAGNDWLADLMSHAEGHFGTQGDGNHFLFVGRLKSTGQIAVVTHHGSRGLGAQLYKKAMDAARKHTAIVAPKVPDHNAWIRASSKDGETYWDALQTIRAWTKASHFALHDMLAVNLGAAVVDRFWNEHNFVFRKSDGLFYHGKGATPSYAGFAADDSGLTLIPLNMAAPILIARHVNNKESLGFAPHGAGRNLGRKAFLRDNPDLAAPDGIDIRAYLGKHDASEFPAAYKNADTVRKQIERFGLAEIVDEVLPLGGVMAGDWIDGPPWREKAQRRDQKGAICIAA